MDRLGLVGAARRARGVLVVKPARIVLLFLAKFLVVTVLLSLAFRWIGPTYLAGFRLAANLAIPSMGTNCNVSFKNLPDDSRYRSRYHDTEMVLRNEQTRVSRTKVLGARVTAYVPTVMLIALVLATPVPWPRRGRALAWGLVILQVVILIRVAVAVLFVVSRDEVLGVMALGPFAEYVVVSLFNALTRSTLSSYVIAAIIWIAVTFRRAEWNALTGGTSVT